MRSIVVVIAVVFICLAASCTQNTCATYTKGIEKVPQEQPVVVEEDQRI